MKKHLRSGYTTGACAASAAKAAAIILLDEQYRQSDVGARRALSLRVEYVEIPFPDGSRHAFKIQNSKFKTEGNICTASASVIKDAGDDPDITHGAEIVAEACIVRTADVGARRALPLQIDIKGGPGVGIVTKPGLAIPVGEPAINPVPRNMIEEAVREAIDVCRGKARLAPAVEIIISVPKGEELAKKTLNSRLGILGGISILGTTGIVKPVSTEAWTATISSSMDVARATGQKDIVISAGRASEKAHLGKFYMPEESYVLMGDYLEYSLEQAARHGFESIHLCAQWAKMLKIAMATPQTHVRFGAINVKQAVALLNSFSAGIPENYEFNTAREIFDFIHARFNIQDSALFTTLCNTAKKYAERVADGIRVKVYLVSYDKEIIAESA